MAAFATAKPSNTTSEKKAPLKSMSQKGKGKQKERHNAKPMSAPLEATSSQQQTLDSWNWTSLSDPSSSKVSPIFSKDGNYFFALVGSAVKIHSSAAGQVVSTLIPPTLEGQNSSGTLTCALINPNNPFQLFTGSSDGRLLIWDFVHANVLRTVHIGKPIHYLCAHEQLKDSVIVLVSRPVKSGSSPDNNAVVLQVHLKHTDASQRPGITVVGKTRSPSGLAISANGAWLVATAGHKVYVAKTEALSSGFTKYVSPDRLICLAFHPSEEYFATGDTKGVIRLWYCLNDGLAIKAKGVEKRTQTRSLHWHAHAVSSLAFTKNGAYLLSGGEEAVLVVWQLHTGKKEYVPRVGAPISTISVTKSGQGEEEYLLGLADASLLFIGSATLKITRTFPRLKTDPTITYDSPSSSKVASLPLATHNLSSTLILPSSHPSSLQIYSPSASTLVSELEVSPSNRVLRTGEKLIIPARVEKVTLSPSGEWMATIDSREGDSTFHPEVYLKLWQWDNKEKSWTLHTRINRPHGIEAVSSLSFSVEHQSRILFLASIGGDTNIKVWRLSRASGKDSVSDAWTSHISTSFRSAIPSSISWSPDGSLLAVAADTHMALYDSSTGDIRQLLNLSESQSISYINFIGPSARYILSARPRSLLVWDLIENKIHWQRSTPQTISQILCHPTQFSFVVTYSPHEVDGNSVTNISAFNTSSPEPTLQRSIPFALRTCAWNTLRKGGINIMALTTSWKLIEFGDVQPTSSTDATGPREINIQDQSLRKTLFQDIFGPSAFAEYAADDSLNVASSRYIRRSTHKDFSSAFAQPTYQTPSLSDLFDPLMTAFLEPRPLSFTQTSFSQENDHDEDEDIVMDDEAVVGDRTSRPSRSVGSREMEVLTQLFKSHCMTATKSLPPPVPKLNGKANSVHPKEPSKPLATPSKPAKVQNAENSNTPVASGKKRKTVPS